MVHVQIKQFLLLIGVVTCWKAKNRVTANNQTGGPLDSEQSDITSTELQNHQNRSLGKKDKISDHKAASHHNDLTKMAQNDRNQTSTRQTPIEINTGKTTRQEPAFPSCRPVHAQTWPAADNSSHADKEHALTMTSVPMYGQRSQTVEDKSPDGMWRDLFQDVNYTKRNTQRRQTRVRIYYPRPDGDSFVSRRPVTYYTCSCPLCSTTKDSYNMGDYENAIYLKPAKASTSHVTAEKRVVMQPCSAVNGIRAHQQVSAFTINTNCFRTAQGDRDPWWSVDMVYVYTVSALTLYAYEEADFGIKMAGIDIKVDSFLCFDFYRNKGSEARELLMQLGLVVNITCSKPLTGTFLRFERRLVDVRSFPSTISLCEVQVWVCKTGTYGKFPERCQPCPTKCKYTCDNYWGCNKLVLHNAAAGRPVRTPFFRYGCTVCITDSVRGTGRLTCLQGANVGQLLLYWIDVRLAQHYLVFYVIIAGRVDCCSPEDLSDFNVTVRYTSAGYDHPLPAEKICGFYAGEVPTRGVVNVTCTKPRWGIIVGIARYGRHELSLCELEVYAHHRFRLNRGARCQNFSEVVHCNVDSICDNGQCRLLPGILCTSSSQCISQGFCEQGICKLQVNAECDVNTTHHCGQGQVCDPSQKKCKLNFGERCVSVSNADVCLTDHICDVDGTCRKDVGKSCRNSAECVNLATCTNGKCRFSVNTDCIPNQQQCGEQRTCDASLRKCRIVLDYKCTKDQPVCQSSAVCDRTTFLCKTKRNSNCTRTTQCLSGASCFEGRCSCDLAVSTEDGDECKPNPGLVGSPCARHEDCENALCTNGVCACSTKETVYTRRFSCSSTLHSCSGDQNCSVGLECDENKCKLKIGGFCFGIAEYCSSKATCDGNICNLVAGKSCVGHENNCISKTICSGGICKIQLGEECRAGEVSCAAGICSAADNNTCRLEAGERCASNTEVCRSGTICEYGRVCKLDFGQECSDSSLCLSDHTCAQKGNTKKCRKPLGSVNCRTDEDCGINAICDQVKQCRYAKNSNCERSPGLCLTGGLCVEGTCQCNPNVTDPETEKCVPKNGLVAGRCDQANSCRDPGALCKDGTCQCDGTFAIDHRKLICGIRPGLQCSHNMSLGACVSGALCTGGFCLLGAGESCVGENQGNCQIRSICGRDSVCRIDLHQNCSDLPLQCRLYTVCDTLSRCKRNPGSFCRDATDCMAGSHCQNNTCNCTEGVATLNQTICSVNDGHVGGNCKQDGGCVDPLAKCNLKTKRCECSPGYTPDPGWLKCVKAIGEKCTNDSDCLNGTTCDRVQKKCLISLGQLCDGMNTEFCSTGTVCDSDFICKLDLKGKCSGENNVFCRRGTFCDWLQQCNSGVDDVCNQSAAENACVAGAICKESACKCNTAVSSQYGALCEPKAGRYGGQCAIKGSDCDVDHSVCDGSACVCSLGYKPNRVFECESTSKKQVTGETIIAVSVTTSLLLLIVFAIFYVSTRRRNRMEAVDHAVAQRKGSMHAIQVLGKTVRDIADQEMEMSTNTVGTSSEVDGSPMSVTETLTDATTSVFKETSISRSSGAPRHVYY